MHTEIFNNIDTLIMMAGSTLKASEIEAELIAINREMQEKKQAIEDLKSIMNDSRYFNASNELVDKNIEVSLKSKISRLNRKIKNLNLKLDKIKARKNELKKTIDTLKTNISEGKEYLELLQSRTNSKAAESLQQVLEHERKHIQTLEQELIEKEEEFIKIKKEVEKIEQELKELVQQKDDDETRLKAVQKDLNSPSAYLDEELKKQDEDKLADLNNDLEKLQAKKLEYLTDANMVGADAKELIINANYTEALAKVKELLNIVKERPFMNVTNISVLDEELEKKERERAELSSLIDNKDYASMNSDVTQKRIAYLNLGIEQKKKEIEQLNVLNMKANQDIKASLANLINSLETDIENTNKAIDEYHILLQDSTKSNKTKANLESAILKKQKEKDVMEKVLSSYKKDLLFQLTVSNNLDKMVRRFNQVIEGYTKEIEQLNRTAIIDRQEKDYIEEEKDKDRLKAINEEIRQIKDRKKFDKTPDEIYDQIEMLLADTKVNGSLEKEESKVEPLDLEIDDLFIEKEEPRFKVVEMIPAQTVTSNGGTLYGA